MAATRLPQPAVKCNSFNRGPGIQVSHATAVWPPFSESTSPPARRVGKRKKDHQRSNRLRKQSAQRLLGLFQVAGLQVAGDEGESRRQDAKVIRKSRAWKRVGNHIQGKNKVPQR